mgnify:CR=1 FL=1
MDLKVLKDAEFLMKSEMAVVAGGAMSGYEILPYQKNKRILLVNLQFKLYAQKDAATAAAEAAAAAEEAKANQQQADSQSTPPSPQPADGGTSPEAE